MAKTISNKELGSALTDALNKRIEYEHNQGPPKTIQIEDLEQFGYHIAKGMMPHQALETMIKHNQKLNNTLKYLISMTNAIKVYQSETGELEDE